jgi:ribonucleotide monophosphatase NagD (HAD superfamily)
MKLVFFSDPFVKAKEAMRRDVVFDIDGVIFENLDEYKRNTWGAPIPGAADFLALLRDTGFRVVLFTARDKQERPALRAKLKEEGIPYDELQMNKPIAIAYVDDRAIPFKSDKAGQWGRVAQAIEALKQ